MHSSLFQGSVGRNRVAHALSSSATPDHISAGDYYGGLIFGFAENFLGKKCFGTTFDSLSDGATDSLAAALPHTMLIGAQQPFFLCTSASGGAELSSSKVYVPASDHSHGQLKLATVGTPATACMAGFCQEDSAGEPNEWINLAKNNAKMTIRFYGRTGQYVPVAQGLMQFGMANTLAAAFKTDIAGAFATDACYIQIEGMKAFACVKIGATVYKSPEYIILPPDGQPFVAVMGYYGGSTSDSFSVMVRSNNGENTVSVKLPANIKIASELQVFGRIGHTAAFNSADALSADIDVVAVNILEKFNV